MPTMNPPVHVCVGRLRVCVCVQSAWLNAALAILGKRPKLCKFLGISQEYIGVTIVGAQPAADYEAHGHLFEVTPSVRPSGA